MQRWLVPMLRPFMKSPADGAATSIHLATSPDLEQKAGQYYANLAARRSSPRSYNEGTAARLWQVSNLLAGLDD